MSGELRGKVALIIQGQPEVCSQAAGAFAAQGAKVVLGGHSQALGAAAVRAIRSHGGQAIFVPTDLTDVVEIDALMAIAVETYDRLDFLLNSDFDSRIPSVTGDSAARDSACAGLASMRLCIAHAVPYLLPQPGASIVNITPVADGSHQHGVLDLTARAAREFEATGVRINALQYVSRSLPWIAPLAAADTAAVPAPSLEPFPPTHILDTIAAAALWLCSEAAKQISGHVLSLSAAGVEHT